MPEVVSSNIKSVDWNAGNLLVVFKSGEAYRYYGVPYITYREMLIAPSVGKYFDANIRKASYGYEKLAFGEESPVAARSEIETTIEDLVINLEQRGLVRREEDESGNLRVVFLGQGEVLQRIKEGFNALLKMLDENSPITGPTTGKAVIKRERKPKENAG